MNNFIPKFLQHFVSKVKCNGLKITLPFTGSATCPVQIFKLYISKLNPNMQWLWQRPKRKIKDPFGPWYDAIPLGKDPLNGAMKKISERANLANHYTNHCIRATVVSTLDDGGFEARHIMAQTGHKSEASIKSYAKKCPVKKKREMSHCLANAIKNDDAQAAAQPIEEPPPKISKPSATISVPTENPEIIANAVPEVLPENFNIIPEENEEIDDKMLVKVLEEIEKENAQVKNKAVVPQQEQPLQSHNINVQNVANISKKENVPIMYFNNSNVTINYNYKQ